MWDVFFESLKPNREVEYTMYRMGVKVSVCSDDAEPVWVFAGVLWPTSR